jgi:hypothetical protein
MDFIKCPCCGQCKIPYEQGVRPANCCILRKGNGENSGLYLTLRHDFNPDELGVTHMDIDEDIDTLRSNLIAWCVTQYHFHIVATTNSHFQANHSHLILQHWRRLRTKPRYGWLLWSVLGKIMCFLFYLGGHGEWNWRLLCHCGCVGF